MDIHYGHSQMGEIDLNQLWQSVQAGGQQTLESLLPNILGQAASTPGVKAAMASQAEKSAFEKFYSWYSANRATVLIGVGLVAAVGIYFMFIKNKRAVLA